MDSAALESAVNLRISRFGSEIWMMGRWCVVLVVQCSIAKFQMPESPRRKVGVAQESAVNRSNVPVGNDVTFHCAKNVFLSCYVNRRLKLQNNVTDMERVIREGALRLLTAEATCDVILSCQGHRLMAHKLILSMASPVFRGLLVDDCSDPTVVILPDINGNIMSLILDYIYTGSVVVYSNTIHDFLGVAGLLKIHLDVDYPEGIPPVRNKIFPKGPVSDKCHFDEDIVKKKEEVPYQEKVECLEIVSVSDPEVYSRRNLRKLPNLLPIRSVQVQEKPRPHRKLCSYVLPSPWCPRVERMFGDPRNDYLEAQENQISPTLRASKFEENDSNNNFQFQPVHTLPKYRIPNKPNDTLSSIYQNTAEKSTSIELNVNKQFEQYPVKSLTDNRAHTRVSCLEEDKNIVSSPNNSLRRKSQEDAISTLQLQKENLSRAIENIRSAGKEEILTTKTPLKDVLGDVIRDTSSNNSGSLDGECDRSNEDDKPDTKDEKQKPFRCEDCGKSFSQLRNYKYHRSVHEGTKEFAAKCPECGKVFNDRGYLSSHLKIHRDKKEYACPHCPKRFNQRVAYNMHLRIHTGVKPHECSVCSKSFSRKMLLKQHQRVHTGERPYSCPECGKTFADRSNMSLHARLHTGVKPYACNLCPKSFTKKHHLKTHMNFHTGLKPYTCEKCGLAFSQSSNMRTHYKKCILRGGAATNSGSEGPKDSS